MLLFEVLSRYFYWAVAHPDEATYVLLAASVVYGWIKRLAVSKQADRLAIIREAAKNSGGRILLELTRRLPGESVDAFVKRRIIEEAVTQSAEFDKTGKKVTLTPEKMAGIIAGQLGQNPAAIAAGISLPAGIPVLDVTGKPL